MKFCKEDTLKIAKEVLAKFPQLYNKFEKGVNQKIAHNSQYF